MVRRIDKDRKISKDRVLKLRHPKNKIIIAVEGKNKTENCILIILIMVENLTLLQSQKVMTPTL